ncbi:58_t:CDS:10 [Entrophospora sp. SA101]|nr:58_t:CDS:10 [Entrophospora sp. SA101]CAJ0916664.1 18935_t:CDS:10 [Entrophospora sp. SA101]
MGGGNHLQAYNRKNETPEDKKNRLLAEKAAKKRSDSIDKMLKAEKERLIKTKSAKLLLLGSAESGKTTVLKQLKIIHGKGLEEERQSYRKIVHLNVLTAMKLLITGLQYYEYALKPKNEPHLENFLKLTSIKDSLNRDSISVQAAIKDQKLDDSALDSFSEYIESVKELWADDAIKKCYDHATEIGLQDSAKYFLDNVDRISKEDYLPTDEDILQARVRTMGVTEHKFEVNNLIFRIFDVGGHRSQRQFWAPYFDDVDAIIFIAAISAYDQTLEEDNDVNRVQDSIQLFEKICNHNLFTNTGIILFLNKIDILKHKLTTTQVKKYFPDYEGDNEYDSVTEYFQNLFLDCNENEDKHIYTHLTHATDTKYMRVIVASVNDIVIKINLARTVKTPKEVPTLGSSVVKLQSNIKKHIKRDIVGSGVKILDRKGYQSFAPTYDSIAEDHEEDFEEDFDKLLDENSKLHAHLISLQKERFLKNPKQKLRNNLVKLFGDVSPNDLLTPFSIEKTMDSLTTCEPLVKGKFPPNSYPVKVLPSQVSKEIVSTTQSYNNNWKQQQISFQRYHHNLRSANLFNITELSDSMVELEKGDFRGRDDGDDDVPIFVVNLSVDEGGWNTEADWDMGDVEDK